MKAEYESGLLTAMESIKISWVKLIVCIKYDLFDPHYYNSNYILFIHIIGGFWCYYIVLGKYYSIKIVL